MYTVINDPVIYPVVLVYVNGIKCRALLDSGAGGTTYLHHLQQQQQQQQATKTQRIATD